MTSEGGGAVAFPVMTLALGIKPAVARDFSLMIQSCGKITVLEIFSNFHSKSGMTAAAFTIFWMQIKLEKHSLVFCSTGAAAGMIFGEWRLSSFSSSLSSSRSGGGGCSS